MRNIAILIVFVSAAIVLLTIHVQKNDSWKIFFADIKVATQLEKIDVWKDIGAKDSLLNELGKTVSVTNYTRATLS